MPGFISFVQPVVPSPEEQWANSIQVRSTQVIRDFFQMTRMAYQSLWVGMDTNPNAVIQRLSALGTGAQAAFLAHAAAISYLLTTLPLFDGTDDMMAQAKTWQIPTGWVISFNDDGTANVTPPVGQ